MGKFIDLTNQCFGRLVVVCRAENTGGNEKYPNGRITYLCQCDCGKEVEVQGGNLRSGQTRSCGCLKRELAGKIEDLTGGRFGRLTVVRRVENTGRTEKRPRGRITFFCQCDCGEQVLVKAEYLRNGDTRSCGCLQREASSINALKYTGENHPQWKGGRAKSGEGYILVHQPDHLHANHQGYIFEHRLVMEDILGRPLRPEEIVHHANGIKDDNSEENLVLFTNNSQHISYENKLKLIAEHT